MTAVVQETPNRASLAEIYSLISIFVVVLILNQMWNLILNWESVNEKRQVVVLYLHLKATTSALILWHRSLLFSGKKTSNEHDLKQTKCNNKKHVIYIP